MNFGYGPISDMARELLGMKQFDRARAGLAGLGGAGIGAAGAASASPRSGGLSGGGGQTAIHDAGYWEKYRAESQAKRDAEQKASDAEWSGMMADAAKKTKAFNDAGAKEWSDNESLKSGTLPRTQFSGMGTTSPTGANGQQMATDQNGGTQQAQSSGSSGESSSPSSSIDEEKKDEEQGYDMASSDSGGEPRAAGGPVRAGGLYHVAEGGRPEAYVQNDGDVYPLTRDSRIKPREDGVIVPNVQVAQLSRQELNRRRAEIDRRARSGDIDALPQHYWTQDERAAMAPILAKREADAKGAEQRRIAAIASKNPYRAQLEVAKTNVDPEEKRIYAIGESSRTDADRLYLQKRQQAKEQLQSMADAVDAANDPYVKIKNEEAQARQAQQKEARTQREQAMARVAEGVEQSKDFGSPEANAQAEGIAKAYRQGLLQQAGGGRVAMPQSSGLAPGEAPSVRSQELTQPSAQATPQQAARQALGGSAPSATPQATNKPAVSAPPAAQKPDDVFTVAWNYSDPRMTADQRRQIVADMTPEQQSQFRTVLADTVQARGRRDADLRAVGESRNSVSVGDTLSEMGRVARRRLGLGGGSAQPEAQNSDRYNMDIASGMGGEVQGGPVEPIATPAEALRRSRLDRPQAEDFDYGAGVGGDVAGDGQPDMRTPAGAVRDMVGNSRKYRASGMSY